MKTVFNSSELPHVWVHQQAPAGRCPSSMSFEGKVFYSYAAPIAGLVGNNVVLLNNTRYSKTTSKHQCLVRRAIPNYFREFFGKSKAVSNPEWFARDLMTAAAEAQQRLTGLRVNKPRRKREIADLENKIANTVKTCSDLKELFNFALDCSIEGLEVIRESMAKREAEEAARRANEAEEAAKRAKESLRKWLDGEDVPHWSLPSGQTYLRVYVGGGSGNAPAVTVQTSKGISIPIAEARESIQFVRSKRETGWRRNGEQYKVVGYDIDSISSEGVVAGCHRVSWSEIDRIAKLIEA